ncbi:MAG: helix-turn-helix domain-containing protein [Lachnospiraceae bacterium]
MNIEIANRLVNLRKQNNLSQEALAEKLGISRQAVSKWERAEASPDTDNLILLARLYGVSLDELLKTEDEIPMPEPEEWQADDRKEETDEPGQDDSGEDTYYEDADGKKVHIGKDGIHVTDGNDQVHIGWGGIHVQEHGGDEVHVGWDGIHVNEGGEEVVWTNRDGFGGMEPKLRFPVGLIICIAYLIIGIAYNAWHPGWLILLLIPILESLITAVKRRNASRFAYPIVALLFFLAYRIFAGSWMGWIAFLTIPIYYSLISYIKSLLRHRRWKKAQKAQRVDYREVREEE